MNSHFKGLSLTSKYTLFDSLQEWIRDISSKISREKLSKEEFEALKSPAFKSGYREYQKLFSSVQIE